MARRLPRNPDADGPAPRAPGRAAGGGRRKRTPRPVGSVELRRPQSLIQCRGGVFHDAPPSPGRLFRPLARMSDAPCETRPRSASRPPRPGRGRPSFIVGQDGRESFSPGWQDRVGHFVLCLREGVDSSPRNLRPPEGAVRSPPDLSCGGAIHATQEPLDDGPHPRRDRWPSGRLLGEQQRDWGAHPSWSRSIRELPLRAILRAVILR